MMDVKKTLAAIQKTLPSVTVKCLDAKDPDCAGGGKGQATDQGAELHGCQPYFDSTTSDVFRAVTFIFAAAIGAGKTKRCRRSEPCYDDFTAPASTMLDNPYSYGWFAVETAGLSAPVPGIVPCRPQETGFWVVVPPEAKKDPSRIRRLNHSDPTPAGSEIVEVWRDTSGRYFIYRDIEGAKQYLTGEDKRYYFPEGTHP